MKYILNQRLISIGDDFTILDENKDKVFKIDGKVLTIGEKLYFSDSNDNKIFKIKKKLLRLTETYIIEKDGDIYATLKKDLINIIRDKFEIETPYGTIKVKGNFIDYDYTFKLNGNEIGKVSKKLISIRDKYIIDIKNFTDHALILASAVIIDMICHNKDDKDNKKEKQKKRWLFIAFLWLREEDSNLQPIG